MPFLSLEGNEIFYEVRGAGTPLVFLHDGLLHRAAFESQFNFFATAHTVIRYDRLGYGDSPPPRSDYSDVALLKNLLAHLKIEAAILIGGSAGGRLAIDFALAQPAQVRALVLVGAAIRGMEWTDHFYYRGWHNKFPERDEEWFEFWTNDPYFIAPQNIAARATMRALLTQHPNNLASFEVKRLDNQLDSLRQLSNIQAPALVVVGEHDIADNHAAAGILEYALPHAQRAIINHSGHVPYLEQPTAFNELVQKFISELK